MLRANIEYESGFFGGIKRIIVQGPNGTKTFYGEESRDEAEAYYRNEKRLEEEMLLRQKQSDLADLQMREIKERERRTREEELRQKNTPIRPYINEIPQPRQRPRSIIPELNLPNKPLNIPVNSSSQYDPEYIEFQKWKRERDPEYIKFKEEKAKETAETERQRQEIEAQKKREQEKKAITEAKKLLNTAKLQTLNKNLPTALNKITEIESLIQKNTLDDSLKAINLLTNQYSWSIGSGKTVLANLTEFDSQYSKAQADLRAEEKIRREAERKRKEAEQIAAQKRDEAARIAAQRKKEAEDSVRQAKQARAAKRFWRTIFWIAVIAVGIALILNYTDNNNSSNINNQTTFQSSSSSAPSSAWVSPSSAVTPIFGTWKGTMNDSYLGSNYQMVLYNSSGQLSVDYPTLRCKTSLVLKENDSSVFVFTEKLHSGNCTNGDKITFQKVSDNNIKVWVEVKSDGRLITGSLLKD